MKGRGEPADLEEMERLGKSVKFTSRCGLGQTSPNPVLWSLEKFRNVYEALVSDDPEGFKRSFDLKTAVGRAETIIGRESVHCH